MLRLLAALIAPFVLAHAAFAEPATLRTNIEARGPAITLGDMFEDAGAQSSRAVALSPAPGASVEIPARVIASAAAAAGLEWTAPADLASVRVTRSNLPPSPSVSRAQARADASIRRGETITLSYAAPGLSLAARARALEDGAVGQSIRAINLSSNRQVDAVVTGTGAATVAAFR
ncbi:MAG: flagellar basal body P-ring formation protein FlgA [Hyphomonadaceae bacterium]|nr:flagellar basal body P-ring formation protein FlgA [Hyphomonadaceae bacterium]